MCRKRERLLRHARTAVTADQAAMGKLTGDADFETGGRPTRPQAKFATPLAGSKDLRRFASSVVMSALGH